MNIQHLDTAHFSRGLNLRAQEAPSEEAVAEPQDTVVIHRGEQAARYTNNLVLHLGVSDAPAIMSIAANYGVLPPSMNGVLAVFNTLNTATGVIAIAADIRETRGTFKNPKATKLDRTMDMVHLLAGDVVSTAASMLPLVTSLQNPIAMTAFVGGQLLGVALDTSKTVYDFKRKGQQSAA
ncbi:hypothetical protein JST97_04760 [bacterium]|nr:hypothetical protein [bacterium]